MGKRKGSHWSWSACSSISELTGTWPLSVTWRTRHPCPQTSAALPHRFTLPSVSASWPLPIGNATGLSTPGACAPVLECEVQPVRPTVSSEMSSAAECILGTGSPMSYQRGFSVFTVWNFNWFHRALGKVVPGDVSSSAQ